VVINMHPSGVVEIREGLVRHDEEEPVAQATRTSPIAPRPTRERPAFTADLLRYVACQRSAAVQAALLANPRKGKEAAVVLLLLGFRRNFGVRLTPHACHSAPPAERSQRSHRSIEAMAAQLANRLGFEEGEDPSERPDGVICLLDSPDAFIILENIGRVTDEELDQLLILLPLLCLGQDHLDGLDSGESILNRIAAGAEVGMRSWWIPDAAFLTLLTREQLIGVAKASGAAPHLTGLNGWAKKRLVEELTRYFIEHSTTDDPADQKTREWVPGLLRFPAEKAIVQPEA
jgi:ParB family chromosome partitioning protein